MKEQNLNFSVTGRPKSIFSIRNKMVKKGIDFDNVFDKFAVRIVVDSPLDMMRTMVNIFSDRIGASIIAHTEGETLYGN